jgi:hypothetical protein
MLGGMPDSFGSILNDAKDLAEGEGFEPPIPRLRDNGFQDRRFQPLTHPSSQLVYHGLGEATGSMFQRLQAAILSNF